MLTKIGSLIHSVVLAIIELDGIFLSFVVTPPNLLQSQFFYILISLTHTITYKKMVNFDEPEHCFLGSRSKWGSNRTVALRNSGNDNTRLTFNILIYEVT